MTYHAVIFLRAGLSGSFIGSGYPSWVLSSSVIGHLSLQEVYRTLGCHFVVLMVLFEAFLEAEDVLLKLHVVVKTDLWQIPTPRGRSIW